MDHPSYRRPGTPYGDSYGAFGDNQVCCVFSFPFFPFLIVILICGLYEILTLSSQFGDH